LRERVKVYPFKVYPANPKASSIQKLLKNEANWQGFKLTQIALNALLLNLSYAGTNKLKNNFEIHSFPHPLFITKCFHSKLQLFFFHFKNKTSSQTTAKGPTLVRGLGLNIGLNSRFLLVTTTSVAFEKYQFPFSCYLNSHSQ